MDGCSNKCPLCPVLSGVKCKSAKHPRFCEKIKEEVERNERDPSQSTHTREWVRANSKESCEAPVAVKVLAVGPTISIDSEPIYQRFGRKVRWKPDCGVICAADAKAYQGLRLMLASLLLSHDVPVTVFDLGLTVEQRAWLKAQPIDLVTVSFPACAKFDPKHWPQWVKPILFEQSPYETTVWLDSDIVVERDLSELADMARRDGVVAFPDSYAVNRTWLQNSAEYYDLHPVAQRWESVNSGVMAWTKGHPFVGLSVELLMEVFADPDKAKLVGCWDQGLVKAALETLGIEPIQDSSWNRAAWAPGEQRSLTLDETLTACRVGTLSHFQSSTKPWDHWSDYRLSLKNAPNLSVFVLGHTPYTMPAREWLIPINLTDRDPDQGWGECRIFEQVDSTGLPDSEFIGLATYRWRGKYGDRLWSPWEFGELPLDDKTVLCAQRTDDKAALPYDAWHDHMEHFNPGIKPYLQEIQRVHGYTDRTVSCWSNNFVMHRSVFLDLIRAWRTMRDRFIAKYPVCPYKPRPIDARTFAYIGEAFSVTYLASRADLRFVEMNADAAPPVKVDPVVQAAKAKKGGCRSCGAKAERAKSKEELRARLNR